MHMAIRTREAGSPVLDDTGVNLNRPFYLKLNVSTEPTLRASIIQYGGRDDITNIPTYDSMLNEMLFFSAVSANTSEGVTNPSINVNTLQNFLDNAPNITFEAIQGKAGDGYGTIANLATGIQTMEDIISILRQFSNWNSMITVGKITEGTVDAEEISDTNVYMQCTEGNAGATPTADEWIASLEFVKDYVDVYQIFCSHIDQHLEASADVLKVHKAAVDMVKELQEYTYYIEVPKYTTHYTQGDQPRDLKSIITWIQTCLGTVGNSKYVAYFGGGIKYYNADGNLVDSDVLGTIAGLGDASASQFWTLEIICWYESGHYL